MRVAIFSAQLEMKSYATTEGALMSTAHPCKWV